MTDTNTQVIVFQEAEKRIKTSQMPAIMKGEAGQTDYVAHLSRADILRMIETAKTITPGRRGQRVALQRDASDAAEAPEFVRALGQGQGGEHWVLPSRVRELKLSLGPFSRRGSTASSGRL